MPPRRRQLAKMATSQTRQQPSAVRARRRARRRGEQQHQQRRWKHLPLQHPRRLPSKHPAAVQMRLQQPASSAASVLLKARAAAGRQARTGCCRSLSSLMPPLPCLLQPARGRRRAPRPEAKAGMQLSRQQGSLRLQRKRSLRQPTYLRQRLHRLPPRCCQQQQTPTLLLPQRQQLSVALARRRTCSAQRQRPRQHLSCRQPLAGAPRWQMRWPSCSSQPPAPHRSLPPAPP